MSQDFRNPYAAPVVVDVKAPIGRPLASLGNRFAGALVDGFAGLVFVVPGYGLMLAGATTDPNGEANISGPLAAAGIALILLGTLALLGVQIYLLATRSQSIGKYLVKTQIVDFRTGQPAGLVNILVLRILLNSIIGAIPCVGPIYTLVDIFFIFRDDRRCLHDLLANTSVVDMQ